MDILSARKKAAERARKKKETEAASTPQPAADEQRPAADTPARVAAPAPVEAGPTLPADVAPVESAAAPAETEGAEAAVSVQELELLSFRLGQEEYAVMIDSVKEVLKIRDLTAVPNAPDYVLGVTSLRGPILPVIDLCKRLGLPPGTRDEKSRIIVVNLNDEEAGIVVDRVTGVVRTTADAIRPAPETIEHGAEFLRGIVRTGDKMYILLDIERAAGA